MSTKRLTEDLISKYSIFNGAKYFSSDGFQNNLVFISTRRIYWISKDGGDSKFNRENLQEYYKKVLETRILQTLVFLPS